MAKMKSRKEKKAGSRKPSKATKRKARKTSKAKSSRAAARSRKPKKTARRQLGRPFGRPVPTESVPYSPLGPGPASGGQSGAIQGIPDVAEADSESAQELLEEGQSFEAEVIDAVENAPDPDQGELRTREVPEDDVPEEYRESEP